MRTWNVLSARSALMLMKNGWPRAASVFPHPMKETLASSLEKSLKCGVPLVSFARTWIQVRDDTWVNAYAFQTRGSLADSISGPLDSVTSDWHVIDGQCTAPGGLARIAQRLGSVLKGSA